MRYMQVFIFQSSIDSEVFGFTKDQAGGNLPPDLGPWKPHGNAAMSTGQGVAGIGPSDPILAAIEASGFYVGRSGGVEVTRSPPTLATRH